MLIYGDLVLLLNFLVDFLLLLGTNRLSGYPPGIKRAAMGAALGGVYAFVCLLPGFSFLGNLLWRIIMLGLIGAMAFGIQRNAIRRGLVFVLLSFSLSGAVLALGSRGMGSMLLAAAAVAALCAWGLRGKIRSRELVPIELTLDDRKWILTALIDTGNALRDPVTGEQVIVAGAKLAWKMLGLTPKQLAAPIETMASGKVHGLRLIPYRAVGQPNGMLLAIRCRNVRVGDRIGDMLIAFAPEGIGENDEYEMLVGGTV